MDLPRLNTDYVGAGHAHPSAAQPSPVTAEQHRIRGLITRQNINVELLGLSCEKAMKASDILTPKIRRSAWNEQITTNHLDLVKCWKGLSHTQALELLMWYRFFHACLEIEVQASLCNDLVDGLAFRDEPVDEIYLIPFILDYLTEKPRRTIEISFVDLIDSMMGMFHDEYPTSAASTSSQWSAFPGGLSLFLRNFLRMQDCFLDTHGGTYILVDFMYGYRDSVLTGVGSVLWQLPNLRFLDLPTCRTVGEEYRITPLIRNDCLSPVSSPGLDDYIDDVTYTLLRSPLAFGWDSVKQCFRTMIPTHSGDHRTIETVLNATIVTPFPDYVRFERQSRWSIRVDIFPAESPFVPSFRPNKGVERSMSRENVSWHQQLCNGFDDNMRKDASMYASSDHNTVLRNTSNAHSTLQGFEDARASIASQKRKVSIPGAVGMDMDAKRRRRDSVTEYEDELGLCTRTADEEGTVDLQSLRWWGYAEKQTTENKRLDTTHVVAYNWHNYSSTGPAYTPYPTERQATIPSPADSAYGSSSTPAPSSVIAKDYMTLEQERIIRNYREFAALKAAKEAGVIVSPTSDGERRAFESIFLGDGEEWSPVTDEDTANVDAVMGEV